MSGSHPTTEHRGCESTHTETLTIRNTLARRLLTRLAVNILGRFHTTYGVCTPVSKHLIVKAGRRVHLREAMSMMYVAERTSIPVPKVYCSFVHKERTFIVMEMIRGEVIPAVWESLEEASRGKIYSQLKTMLHELRTLSPPPDMGVANCFGGGLADFRLSHESQFGPFKTIQDFHLWLRNGLQPSEVQKTQRKVDDSEWEDIERMAALQDTTWPPPVFTHGDLNPYNILIRDGEVVGIIDWEFAGWYPCYWEYTSASLGNVTSTDWRDALDRFLEPYPAELDMEKTRQRWWGKIY